MAEVITERSRSGVGAGVWLFLPEPELNFLYSAGAGAGFRNLVGVGVLITGIIVCSQSDKDFETRQKHLFRLEI